MASYSVETTVNVALPKFTRGDTYDWTLPFVNADGTAYDFTQWEGLNQGIRGQMRLGGPDGDSIGVVTWTSGVGLGIPLGSARVRVESDVAENATGGVLYYDVEGFDSTASPVERKTIVSGRIPIIRDVTQLP